MVYRDLHGNFSEEFYTTNSRGVNSSHIEDLTSGVENSPSRKLPRSASDGEVALFRPDFIPLTKTSVEPRANSRSRRRRSIREPKASGSSSASQISTSKRLSNSFASYRPNASNISKDQHPRQTSINDVSRFSFASIALSTKHEVSNGSGNHNFLPEVHFEDFHQSLASEEADLNSFPAPRGGESMLTRLPNGHIYGEYHVGSREIPKRTEQLENGARVALNNTSSNRQDSHANQRMKLAGSVSMGPPIVPSVINTRRKSHFPPTSISNEIGMNRPPRKSIGPGIVTSGFAQPDSQRRRPSVGYTDSNKASSISGTTAPVHRAADQAAIGDVSRTYDDAQTEGSRNTETFRNKKVKSFQPSQRLAQEYYLLSSGSIDHAKGLKINTCFSPARSPGQRVNTPLSGKRSSVMPGSTHATGLGARTISPTDARRIKRMSIMPNPPPLPSTPPTPQADLPISRPRSPTHSPSTIPRKSITPSSSRTTPEVSRKSYSSGISNSSSTSYNSFLNSMASSRMSQSLSSSRLPTPKSRLECGSVGGEEEVPPVPAIPKAYESPKGDFDQPYFSVRKSSLPIDTSSHVNSWNTDAVPSHSIDSRKGDGEHRQPRGLGIEASSGNDGKSIVNSRKNLQPLRLPPLNLLPLSTPTAAKIAALYEGASAMNLGNMTPPPKLGTTTAPSTPMTASKASFFSQNSRDEHSIATPVQRPSSSSQRNISGDSFYRAPSSTSSTVPIIPDQYVSRAGRKPMSPFVSSSLPKGHGDFVQLASNAKEAHPGDANQEMRASKLMGPRSQKPAKAGSDEIITVDDQSLSRINTPTIGNSLRRKLSLNRKRSESKNQLLANLNTDPPPNPPKHDQMPPPKLPASATWNGPFIPSPSPTQKLNFLNSKRKVSIPNIGAHHERTRSNTWGADLTPKKETVLPGPVSAVLSTKTSKPVHENSIMSNSVSLKDFLRETKSMELQLDRDDLLAEDEMKKLAAKRKDTESAAKEIDALRRRATAKERVSSSQAVRIAPLNIFERGEIVDFKDVYFCGTQDARKFVGDLSTDVANFGYDDERGDYHIVKGDHLFYRYEIVDVLGKGSFGQVVRCIDHKTGGLVAIKIIRNKKRFHQQALVEVDILQKLREWDPYNRHSMVNFTQSFYFRSHLCISTELLGMNLYEFIKCHDFRGFSLRLIRRFSKQLLSSLILLKSHKVIHCDLKPENILLAHPAHSEIKVIDFGSSCLENEKVYTYIQSRFYRSPEVILGMTYGMPIDMWSLGCILAELLTGYPIFPGENEQEQLACIMEVFGPPEKHLIEKSTRKKLFFDSLGKPRLTVSSKGKRRRPSSKSLQQVLKCEDEAFLDFISRCLRWDPDRRLKPDEAMRHEFITGTKSSTRPLRPHLSTSASSPVKRYNSIQPSANIRPLPDLPIASFKSGTAIKNRDIPSSSPSKSISAPKRHSTVNGLQGSAGVKRALNGNTIAGSALPRVTPRTASGKPDMAMAAAAASLKSR